jgi:hypothetical protein
MPTFLNIFHFLSIEQHSHPDLLKISNAFADVVLLISPNSLRAQQ